MSYYDGAETSRVVAPPDLPDLADLPAPDTVVRPGDPCITVFAQGTTPAEVAERLIERERQIKSDRSVNTEPREKYPT